ncbi:hypothetical protein ACLBX9_07450 [Methylobacterium sp. A49B]|uniref:Uncharacterized protein n=1 Tax=Methylobacterium mesophilicum SR1.6/6 TaxID=908290 RepID=A0A6B9FH94_9HYPH|nr:hypothetical protein [Methylobacterium mesophilicum]QGY02033.1 hypothetical protein MMSR116_09175 [Methylobacterium mesophilicum SR1.6/6]
MALVLRTTLITTVRSARVPVMLAPTNDAEPRVVTDAARYLSIGSLQALALAVAASVVTPALLWLAL